jgi:hypothetical protein
MRGARVAGVSWNSKGKRWLVKIKVTAGNGESKMKYLGNFVNEKDAALAYDQAARKYHKAKAKLNFPDLPPPQPQAASSQKTRQGSSQYHGEGRSR